MNLRRLTSLLALSTPLALQTGCGKCDGGDFFYCYQPAAVDSESDSGTDSTGSTEPAETTTTTMTSAMSGTETMGTTGDPCNMNGICEEGESPATCQDDCMNCGNGVVEKGEDCDNGKDNSPDNAYHAGGEATAPCNSSCTGKVPHCGDGVCQPGPENTMACPEDGCVAKCGNGVLEADEACDDGNLANTDACLDTCQPASCGDGFVQDVVEACDDANTKQTDACVMCNAAKCGDGFTWAGMEDCDDANAVETDACDIACKTVVHRKVFVSSDTYNGKLSGLSGADIRCNTVAGVAQLAGNFQAWLSDETTGPADRFDTSFTGVYELVDGTIVAHGWADLIDGSLSHAISLTEKNGASNASVWTNTTPEGLPLGASHCTGWTSDAMNKKGSYGSSGASDGAWTQINDGPIPCNFEAALYCFEDPADR